MATAREDKIRGKEQKRKNIIDSMRRIDLFVQTYTVDKIHEVTTRLERLEKVWYGFEEVQEELDKLTLEGDNAENEKTRAEMEELYMSVRSNLLRLKPSSNPIVSDVKPVPIVSQMKLPVIQLPEFGGDFNDWLPFHDTFVSLIDKSDELSGVQKLHYLKAALKGEAARLIEPILTTDENYKIAWQMLVDRYGNKHLLKKRHIQAILRLPKIINSNLDLLRRTVDDFQRHTLVLEQLGEPIKHLSSFLVELLSEKLDSATLAAWEEAQADKSYTYSDMVEFLRKRVRLLETLANDTGETSKRQPRVKVSVNTAAAAEKKVDMCVVCGKQGHTIVNCRRFNEFDAKKRQQVVRQHKLCWNCLQGSHFVTSCTSRYGCQTCGKRHHTLLHAERSDSVIADDSVGSVSTMVLANIPMQCNSTDRSSYSNVMLTTVVLFVVDANGTQHPVRALLDNGAQPNAISERLSQLLCLPRMRTHVPITGVDGTTTQASCEMKVEIRSRFSEFALKLNFLVLSKVTANTPATSFSTSCWKLPAGLALADPEFHQSGRVDMLIGASHFYTFLREGRLKLSEHGPLLVETVFGWVVTGEVLREEAIIQQQAAQCHVMLSSENISDQLERFWKIEELHVSHFSADEQRCEAYYEQTVSRDETGRYIVKLPKHQQHSTMIGKSETTSLKRHHSKDTLADVAYRSVSLSHNQTSGKQLLARSTRMLEQGTLTTVNESTPADTLDDREVYGSVVYGEESFTSLPSAPSSLPHQPDQMPLSEFELLEALLNSSAGGPMGSFWNASATETPYTPYELRPETYIVPILFAAIFIIGVLGNGTLIIVFLRHRAMRNVPNTYILSLALADLLLIVTTVPFTSIIYTLDSWPWGSLLCTSSEFIKDVSIGVSVFTLVALSGDRFFAIVDPLRKFHAHGGGRRATRMTITTAVLIWLLAIAFAVPAIVGSHIKTVVVNKDVSFYFCYPFPDEWGSQYARGMVLGKFLVYYAVPLFIIGIFYALIARHLIHSAKHVPGEMQGTVRQIKARRKVAITVLAFVVIFGICFLPSHLFMLWFYYNPNFNEDYNGFWHVLRIVGFCLSFANSCANPVALYCVSGAFRKHFNRYLLCDGSSNSRRRHGDNLAPRDTSLTSTMSRRYTSKRMQSLRINIQETTIVMIPNGNSKSDGAVLEKEMVCLS